MMQEWFNTLESALLDQGICVKILYVGVANSENFYVQTEGNGMLLNVCFPCTDDSTGEDYPEISEVFAFHGMTGVKVLGRWNTKVGCKASDYFSDLDQWVSDNEANQQIHNWEILLNIVHAFIVSNSLI